MFGIEALDVVIGMIFIYLLFSLFVSIVNEGINSALQARGKELQFVIYKMLGSDLLKKFYQNYRIQQGMKRSPLIFYKKIYPSSSNDTPIDSFEKTETDKKIINRLKNLKKLSDTLPSEIDASTFGEVLIEELKKEIISLRNDIYRIITNDSSLKNKLEESDTHPIQIDRIFELLSDPEILEVIRGVAKNKSYKILEKEKDQIKETEHTFKFPFLENEYIYRFLKSGSSSLYQLQKELENWYEEMMMYLGDWYKRKLRYILLFLGLLTAGLFNVDSISIFKTLVNDPEARAALVQQAESYAANHGIDENTGLPIPINNTSDTLYVQGGLGVSLFLDTQKAACKNDKTCLDSIKTAYPTLYKIESTYAELDSLIQNDIVQASSTLGIGWKSMTHYKWITNDNNLKNILCAIWHYLKILFGWLITAVALSMGAPFWYDLLRKVINIKNELKGKQNKPVG